MQNDGFGNSAVQGSDDIVNQMMSSEAPVLNTPNQVNSQEATVPNAEPQIEIDPKFANLNPQEGVLRTFQSRYDSMKAEAEKLRAEVEKAKLAQDLLITIAEDDEALEAFLYQRKPELIKKPDFNSWATNKLKAEFGEEFEFDQSRALYDPSHIAYQKRVTELYDEYQKGNQSKVKSLAELRERREQEKQAKEQEVRNMYLKLQETHKLSNEQLKGFVNFISKANQDIDLLFNLWRFANRQAQIPNTPQGSYAPAQSGSMVDSVLKAYGF